MDFHTNRPLDNITRNNPYSMLEALIPFVDYPMKLVLALMIKYQEVKLILNAFQSIDTLTKYGLHNTSSDPTDILANVMGISPEMIKTLISLMESQSINYDDTTNNFGSTLFNSTSNLGSTPSQYDTTAAKSSNSTQINTDHANKSHYVNYNANIPYTDNPTENSFDENIKSIFAEYDLLQAAEYNENNERLQATSLEDNIENRKDYDEYNNNELKKVIITEPEYYI